MTEVTIERIGHLGDGMTASAEGTVLIPFAAPGDVFTNDGANGWTLAQAGPNRVQAPCTHFGACGGCNLQHVARGTYVSAKREWIAAALVNQGIEVPVDPLIEIASHTRRRATFTAIGAKPGAVIGFHRARSHDLVEVPGCEVVRPKLLAAVEALRGSLTARLTSGKDAGISLTDTKFGIDAAVESKIASRPLAATEIAALRAAGLVRLSWNKEILFASAPVQLSFSGVSVDLPMLCFLQATEESEAALVSLVQGALNGVKRVADFYAGIGTFSFALASHAAVDAFEGDAASVAALSHAAHRATGLKPVKAETRDLTRRPVMTAELKAYDGAVLDPPRAGAETQVRQLAKSKVARIAYVSCFPASFARDARLLIEGGYKLERVTPVDQFLWSHHVESIGVFTR